VLARRSSSFYLWEKASAQSLQKSEEHENPPSTTRSRRVKRQTLGPIQPAETWILLARLGGNAHVMAELKKRGYTHGIDWTIGEYWALLKRVGQELGLEQSFGGSTEAPFTNLQESQKLQTHRKSTFSSTENLWLLADATLGGEADTDT
jgi:hypothetical protein